MITQDKVLKALRNVMDPDLGKDIVLMTRLGLRLTEGLQTILLAED